MKRKYRLLQMIKAAALSAAKDLSRVQAERASAAATQNVMHMGRRKKDPVGAREKRGQKADASH